MKCKLLFLLFLILSLPSSACLNEYLVRLDGTAFSVNTLRPTFEQILQGKLIDAKTYLPEIEARYKKTGRFEDYADYGVTLVKVFQFEKAKKIFLEIERAHPGLYNTAANLGTTYELLGKNDSALYWIKKAVAINPSSHNGSEWIHVKILEAKTQNIEDLYHYNILSLDFGNDAIPENVNKINLREVFDQLNYQLDERMYFVKPKDGVMGQLLFQRGNLVPLIGGSVMGAKEDYDLAEKYGYSSHLMNRRRDYFVSLQDNYENWTDGAFGVIVKSIIVLLVSSGLTFLIILCINAFYNRKN